jgi:hypothetical protein
MGSADAEAKVEFGILMLSAGQPLLMLEEMAGTPAPRPGRTPAAPQRAEHLVSVPKLGNSAMPAAASARPIRKVITGPSGGPAGSPATL